MTERLITALVVDAVILLFVFEGAMGRGMPWTLGRSNCQHTTNWAALGIARSEQLEGLIGLGIFFGVLYVLSRN
jgi:hypothetical protein